MAEFEYASHYYRELEVSLRIYLVLKAMLRVLSKLGEFAPESVDSPRISAGK